MGFVDVHSHILPGLDDGSHSMDQSLRMLEIACKEGIAVMIATPHNMPGKGCPSRATVEKKYKQLVSAVQEAGLPITILPGTEYFYRQEVAELFEQEEGITLGGTDKVLIEFDPSADKKYIRNAVREFLALGYVPVIAHVERYLHLMEKHFDAIAEMRKMGALIQVNAASVTGDNGWKTRQAVRTMLKLGLVDLVGSDAHSDGHRAPRMKECADYLYKKLPKVYADSLLNAEALEL